MQIGFEECLLDTDRRELRRGDELVALEPQVFDVLIYLIENRDRVVSKDDLIASVWSGRIVSESTLTSRINAVRKAIGDSGEKQSLIRTFAKKGFRFIAPVDGKNKKAMEPAAPPTPAFGVPTKPSIAVLPFSNMSGEPDQGTHKTIWRRLETFSRKPLALIPIWVPPTRASPRHITTKSSTGLLTPRMTGA